VAEAAADLSQYTRAGYEAFNAGDVETLERMLDPRFEWHEAAEIPGVKSATGRDEFVRFMRGFDRLWDEFGFEPLELRPNGDELVYVRAQAHGRGKASAELVEFEIHHVWRLEHGLFVRMDAYLEADEARAAAGLI
jgi:ketosteroid isomerase-like protein